MNDRKFWDRVAADIGTHMVERLRTHMNDSVALIAACGPRGASIEDLNRMHRIAADHVLAEAILLLLQAHILEQPGRDPAAVAVELRDAFDRRLRGDELIQVCNRMASDLRRKAAEMRA